MNDHDLITGIQHLTRRVDALLVHLERQRRIEADSLDAIIHMHTATAHGGRDEQ